MAKQPLKLGHKVAFLAGAVGILSLSTGMSLYLLGAFAPDQKNAAVEEAEPERFRRITLSDAEHACVQRARTEFGERIWVLTLDRRSSRLDRADQLFKLFYEAELFVTKARQGQPERHYVNCFVAIDRPKVESFQFSADGYEFGEPGEGERGLFGL
jgi:hypothetical protein